MAPLRAEPPRVRVVDVHLDDGEEFLGSRSPSSPKTGSGWQTSTTNPSPRSWEAASSPTSRSATTLKPSAAEELTAVLSDSATTVPRTPVSLTNLAVESQSDSEGEEEAQSPDAVRGGPSAAKDSEEQAAASSDANVPSLWKDGPVASAGSANHPNDCKPCAFYCFSLRGVCRNSYNCNDCHLAHTSKVQQRRKAWNEAWKKAPRSKRAAIFCSAGLAREVRLEKVRQALEGRDGEDEIPSPPTSPLSACGPATAPATPASKAPKASGWAVESSQRRPRPMPIDTGAEEAAMKVTLTVQSPKSATAAEQQKRSLARKRPPMIDTGATDAEEAMKVPVSPSQVPAKTPTGANGSASPASYSMMSLTPTSQAAGGGIMPLSPMSHSVLGMPGSPTSPTSMFHGSIPTSPSGMVPATAPSSPCFPTSPPGLPVRPASCRYGGRVMFSRSVMGSIADTEDLESVPAPQPVQAPPVAPPVPLTQATLGMLTAGQGTGEWQCTQRLAPPGTHAELFEYSVPSAVIGVGQRVEFWPPQEMMSAGLTFTVRPALPQGLSIEPLSGVIHGRPQHGAAGMVTLFITASMPSRKSSGIKVAKLSLKVINVPPGLPEPEPVEGGAVAWSLEPVMNLSPKGTGAFSL